MSLLATALLGAVLAAFPLAGRTGPIASAAVPGAAPSACVYDRSQAWGPWAHTLVVGGNGKAGSEVARSVADGMVPGALDNGGGERDHAWTPASPSLDRKAVGQVRRKHLRAAYFRGVDRRARQLTSRIREAVAECPEEGLLLVGYSQGALALRSALGRVAKRGDAQDLLDHVGGVLLVGDPAARSSDDLRRFGVQRQRGPVRGAALPTVLTARHLVASWCRRGDALCVRKTVSARRGARAHRGYRLASSGESAGRAAADFLTAPITAPRLEAGVHWYGPDFVYGEQFAGWPVVKPLTGAAAELRFDRALSTVPPGMTLADDLTLSGTAPTSGRTFEVTLALHHSRFAPATHRWWSSGAEVYPVRAGRAGVSLVSSGPGGARPDGDSYEPDVSGDGRTVVFVSAATNLVAGDTDGQPNVFVWDRADGAVTRVSDGLGSQQAEYAARMQPHVSADGRLVLWLSAVDHPGLGDADGKPDAYLYDRDTGVTRLASPGTTASISSTSLVADGSRVLVREAAGLYAERSGDVVRSWVPGEPATTVLEPPPGGGYLSGGSGGEALVLSANGRFALAQVGADHVSWDLVDRVVGTSCPEFASGIGGGAVSDDGGFFTGKWLFPNDRDPYSVGITCDHGARTAGITQVPIASLTADARYLTGIDRIDFESDVTVLDRTTGGSTSAYADRSAATSLVSSASADASTVVFDASAFNVVETPPSQRGIREIYLWDRVISP